MFNTPDQEEKSEKEREIDVKIREKTRNKVPNIFRDADLSILKEILKVHDKDNHVQRFPNEITGEFRGEWGPLLSTQQHQQEEEVVLEKFPKSSGKESNIRIEADLSSSMLDKNTMSCSLKSVMSASSKSSSIFSLYVHSTPTKVPDILWLRAKVRLRSTNEEDENNDEYTFEQDAYMVGVYIRPFGEITLFPSVANISLTTSFSSNSISTRRQLLPVDLIQYRETKAGNTHIVTLLSQSTEHVKSIQSEDDGDDEVSKKSLPCLFQLHLSLDSVSSRFDDDEKLSNSEVEVFSNIFDDANDITKRQSMNIQSVISSSSTPSSSVVEEEQQYHDTNFVECSGEMYDFNSNVTISVTKVTSYLYNPLRFGLKSKTYALIVTACGLAQIAALMRQMKSSGKYLGEGGILSHLSSVSPFPSPIT